MLFPETIREIAREFPLWGGRGFATCAGMNAPLSRISLLLAILLFIAGLFQKSIANAIGKPLTEPTQLEQVIQGVKGAAGQESMISVPKHPVPATIFWLAVAISVLALWAWIVEDSFWIPLIAMCVAIAAAMLKMAVVPALLAAVKAGSVQAKRRTTRSRSATIGTTTTTHRKRTSSARSLDGE